jgi:hypothetical protein
MTTYADPTRCPDCHAVLPHDPAVCLVCSLPLTGETAGSLFRSLQEADRLLGVLRTQKRRVPVSVGAPAAPGSLLEGARPYPAADRSTGGVLSPCLRGASVPKILLSLGALCLLVAAVTFLAVAWSWLDVGGRTVVLVALTGAALGLTVALHHRDLRMAAEALAAVGLGLITLDVVGARHAGWLGAIDNPRLTLLGGAVLGTGALLLLVATARRPLVVPALVAPVAVLTAGVGAQWNNDAPVQMLATVIVLMGLGRIGTALPSPTLQSTAIATAVLGWLGVVAGGLNQVGDPVTAADYFGDLVCWPILAATVLAAVVGPVTGVRRVELGGYAVAGVVGTYGLLLPGLDNTETAMVSAVLAASAVWVAVLMVAPDRLRPAALLPLGGTLIVPVVAAFRLASEAGRAVLTIGEPFSRSLDVHVAAVSTEVSPLLLVPALLTTAAAGCAVAQLVEPLRRTWVVSLATAIALGGVATLPLYDVPLALVVGALVVAAVGLFVAAERLRPSAADLARLVVLALTTASGLIALPSDRMVTGVLAVGCAMAGYLMARTDRTGAVASLSFPVAFAGLVWAGGNVVGVEEQFRAVPVLLVLGGLAIWRPQFELEASSAIAGILAAAASVLLADDLSVSMAVHLTVAGALVTASSIIHPTRRVLAWPGGLLLAAATWVRLADLGVHLPEAYTVPSALALVVVGAWRLHQDERSTTLTVLAPGLALAAVPSLLAMLDNPYSLRALVLGAACVVLTVAGPVLRWSAPIVVGAAVGGVLVLRELAPYAAQVPTWAAIGVAGALLLGVGITWESRMNDVRRASRYVAALR